MKLLTFLSLFGLVGSLSAQPFQQLVYRADSAYNHRAYALAGPRYLTAADGADFDFERRRACYDAACCYALTGQTDEAFRCLERAVRQYGYNRLATLTTDTDLTSLRTDPRWQPLLAGMNPGRAVNRDPAQAQLITTDIHNFWRAYDLAERADARHDTAQRRQIYRDTYLAQASPGLEDYYLYKIRSCDDFVRTHDRLARFYAAIRPNTLRVDAQKPQMLRSFARFKAIYPDAQFPPVYFVIGRLNSGGTATPNGLIIGLDHNCRTSDVPLDELSLWQRNNVNDLALLPHVVAHELIHFQQDGLASDTTLLRAALVEGMADFLGELISGRTANPRLATYAKGREKAIWADFSREMHLNRAHNWIANGNQETADKPADLGYWVGYTICKAYYDRAADKKQAVYDMLHIQNYPAFLAKSGVADQLN